MGLMTLEDFRTDMNSALGGQGRDSRELDRWINQGYMDVTGAIDFEVLDEESTPVTVTGLVDLSIPLETSTIKVVKDTTNDQNLGWIPQAEYYRRAVTPTGFPLFYTRMKDLIKLTPVPAGVYNMLIIAKVTPAPLIAESDTTVIPATWDTAVFLLGMHHAWLALNQEQRATVWLGRAITYVQSRMTEKDFSDGVIGLASSFPGLVQRLNAGNV